MNKSTKEYIAKANKESMKGEPSHRIFPTVSDKGFIFTSYRQDGVKVDEGEATKELEKHLKAMKATPKAVEPLNSGKGKGSDNEQYMRLQVNLK
jgi:hypothetical protein